QAGKQVSERAGGGNQGGEDESGKRTNVLVAGSVEGEGDQQGGANACGDGDGSASGDTEGTDQSWLAQPKDDEGDELEQTGRAIEDEVDGDEALEGEIERQCPGDGAYDDAGPRNLHRRGAGQESRKQAVFGERVRHTRIAEHEGVEHAGTAEHASDYDGDCEAGSEDTRADDRACSVGPCASGELAGGDSGESYRGERQYIGEGDQGSRDKHGARVVALRSFDFLSD